MSYTVPHIRRTEDTAYIRSYGLGQPYLYGAAMISRAKGRAKACRHTHTQVRLKCVAEGQRQGPRNCDVSRVGQDHIYYIYSVCTVFWAGKSPNIRSYTMPIYGSGQGT